MSLSKILISVLFLYFQGLSFIHCSTGDRSSDFRTCTYRCHSLNCDTNVEKKLSLSLRLTGWSCLEECQYQCMHEVTAENIRLNRPVQQFFGKWPFVRVFGVQEPASAVFSAFNGLTVVVGFIKFRQNAPKSYPLHGILLFQFLVNLNTWVWSTIFHTRDLNWTEKLDYFSAAALIVVGLIVQFIRISGPNARMLQFVYAGMWVGLLCCHVTYLSMYKFDYGYNMMASVMAGILYAVVWVIWCVKNRAERLYVWKCVVTVMATSCLVLLELLDFAPLWWVFDAHALWHLSTVPLPLMWYSFLTADAEYELQNLMRKHV